MATSANIAVITFRSLTEYYEGGGAIHMSRKVSKKKHNLGHPRHQINTVVVIMVVNKVVTMIVIKVVTASLVFVNPL